MSESSRRAAMESTFGAIYRTNAWGNAESVSGPGSTLARAADFADGLVSLLRRLDTRVLLDAPCGDFNWAGRIADVVDTYIGVDVVPELIAHNRARHAHPKRTFHCLDLCSDPLPAADVILCRDCLVHFSFEDVRAALDGFRRSGSRYLLTTTFLGWPENVPIETGEWRPLNLELPPFSFPPPLALVDEKVVRGGPAYRGKMLGLWELTSA